MASLGRVCALLALRTALGAVVVPGENDTEEAAPCLCAFDIDRTLTGYQDILAPECPGNKVMAGVKDYAYLYASPPGYGNLTLSLLLQQLNNTFCGKCFVGLASAGGASLDDEKAVLLENLKAAVTPSAATLLPETWVTTIDSSEQTQGPPPFVVWCKDKTKHNCTRTIVEWYEAKNVTIASSNVYFFDDKEENVLAFEGSGYNAQQISCATRDGSRGHCGGHPDEVQERQGVHVCKLDQKNGSQPGNGYSSISGGAQLRLCNVLPVFLVIHALLQARA